MRLMLVVTLVLLASGCEQTRHPEYGTHTAVRIERFEACMKLLPAGPVSTKYNDWEEVVRACDSVAYSQSRVCVKNCPTPPEAPGHGE